MDEKIKQHLIEGWFLGTLSSEESQTLEELLLHDKQLRLDFKMAAKVDSFLKTKSEEKSVSSESKKNKDRSNGKHKKLTSSRTKNARLKRPTKTKKTKSYSLPIIFCVAAILAVSFLVFKFSAKTTDKAILQLTEMTTNGSIHINGKAVSTTGSKVNDGDRLSVPKGVKVKLKYESEDTLIELYENSEIKFTSIGGDKHLSLSKGKLRAEVFTQEGGKRMYLKTPHSQNVVLGTVFSLEVTAKSRLEVYEGKVQFESLLSNKKVYVDGGYFSEAGNNIKTAVYPLKIQYPDVSGKKVLYVGGVADLGKQNPILKRLRNIGFTVNTVSDDKFSFAHSKRVDLIIIAASSTIGVLDRGIMNLKTPIISWHSSVFDNLGLVESKDNGDVGTDIQMTNTDHPISAGLNGKVTLFSEEGNNISWGVPGKEAAIISIVGGNRNHASIFAYERGQKMPVGRAGERRVALCYGESIRYKWTSNAWRLFDSSVLWALALESR